MAADKNTSCTALLITVMMLGCGAIRPLPKSEFPVCAWTEMSELSGIYPEKIGQQKGTIAERYIKDQLNEGALTGLHTEEVFCGPSANISSSEAMAIIPWFCEVKMCDDVDLSICGHVAMIVANGEVSESEIRGCSSESPCRLRVTKRRARRIVRRASRGLDKGLSMTLDFRTLEGKSRILWCSMNTDSSIKTLVDGESGRVIGSGVNETLDWSSPRRVID